MYEIKYVCVYVTVPANNTLEKSKKKLNSEIVHAQNGNVTYLLNFSAVEVPEGDVVPTTSPSCWPSLNEIMLGFLSIPLTHSSAVRAGCMLGLGG